jgi:DNA-binding transcriptional LysR family regulator
MYGSAPGDFTLVTLTQLEVFVLVARLGSVKAAADALGVSEPAVSGALAALRRQLDDPLVTRTPTGMALSPAGQRFVPIASQIVGLAAEGEAAVRSANGSPERVRTAATSTVAEFVAPPLIAAFSSRAANVETTLGVAESAAMPALLHERLADVCFGPRLTGEPADGIASAAMMRYRLVVVASPDFHLAGRGPLRWETLVREDWLVAPSGIDPSSEVGMLMQRLRVPDRRVRVFPNQAAAWSAAAAGGGVAPAISHLVKPEIDRNVLCRLAVESTPLNLMWYVSTLRSERRPPGVAALVRFLATSEAVQAMHKSDGAVPPSRFRPPVYVTLWS